MPHSRHVRSRIVQIIQFIGGSGLVISTPAQAISPPASVPERVPFNVQRVASFLSGVMDTSAQAAATPAAANVRMTTCPIQLAEKDSRSQPSVFLYQEQALLSKLSEPYRQRFLQITSSADEQTVESRSFKPTTPSTWTALCNKPEAERLVKREQLGTPVCTVFLKAVGDRFVGETPTAGCPAQVRGAVRITNHIELFSAGMETWDRGFDAQGKQVWGAQTESYHYQRK